MYWIISATIVFVALTTVALEISLFAECRPINAFWNQINPFWRGANDYYCVNEGKKLLAAGCISLLQDVMVTTLPIFLVWNLQLNRAKKMRLVALFSAGYLVCGMGLARVIYTHKTFFSSVDFTWWAAVLGVWTQTELCTGIMVACAPALKTFFTQAKATAISYRSSAPLGSSAPSGKSNHSTGTETKGSGSGGVGLYTQQLDDLEDAKEEKADFTDQHGADERKTKHMTRISDFQIER
jgi:hypothetical protein